MPDEYPEDAFEIYEDAIVFESEDDDEGIELKYGTTDEIEDVIDYYEDLFDDNDLAMDEIEEDNDEFMAQGKGEGFKFEVKAKPAKGDYEERAFTTVVEVIIEYYEMGEETLSKMQGFWLACGAEGIIADATRQVGFAMEFKGNKMDVYEYFEPLVADTEIVFTDEDSVEFDDEGILTTMDISFETVGGQDVMTVVLNGDRIHMEKTTYNQMFEHKVETPSTVLYTDNLTDDELEYWIADTEWYYIFYFYPDGSYDLDETIYNKITLYSDFTGEDDLGDQIVPFSWYVVDSNMYITYTDGSQYYFPIDFEYDGTTAYLYIYDLNEGYEGNAYIYSNYPIY